MALKLPLYRIDSPSIYVHPADDAWKSELITDERTKLEEDDPDAWHPFDLYIVGQTRYSLDEAQKYLDMSKRPTMWYFRRLTMNEYEQLKMRQGFGMEKAAYREAVLMCLNRIDNLGDVQIKKMSPSDKLADSKIDEIRNLVGMQIIWDVGQAIMKASEDLVVIEKKL